MSHLLWKLKGHLPPPVNLLHCRQLYFLRYSSVVSPQSGLSRVVPRMSADAFVTLRPVWPDSRPVPFNPEHWSSIDTSHHWAVVPGVGSSSPPYSMLFLSMEAHIAWFSTPCAYMRSFLFLLCFQNYSSLAVSFIGEGSWRRSTWERSGLSQNLAQA